MDQEFTYFTPRVLLIQGHEWTARSFDSILAGQGCAVFKAYTGQQGLDVMDRLNPDLVLVERHLPDMTGYQMLSRSRESSSLTAATPRVMLSVAPLTQKDRNAAFEAGAWAVLGPPFDPLEVRLRVKVWIEAKRETDRARDHTMIDPMTGLYNYNGLLRRIDEILSDATRNERHLALVAVSPRPAGDQAPESASGLADESRRAVTDVIRRVPRLSDSVGRIGPGDFVILAPGTDQEGAETLVRRLEESLQGRVSITAGIYATRGLKKQPLDSLDVLNRATEALQRSRVGDPDRRGGGVPPHLDRGEG